MSKNKENSQKLVLKDDFSLDFSKINEKNEENLAIYANNHLKNVYFKGEIIDTYIEVNPNIITNMFFKPIVPLTTQMIYNGEQLSMLYDYYNDLILKINDKLGAFPSSLSLFCRFIGLTTDEFKKLRDNSDEITQLVTKKIIDDIDESNLAMAQAGNLKERTTLFRLKAQNELVEKVAPKVNVNVKTNLDDERIKGNILDYKEFLGKKG